MHALTTRNAKPVAVLAAAVATLYLAGPLPRGPAARGEGPAAAARHANLELAQAEVRACQATTGRSWDDCLDESEGKALIRRAERIAELDARRGVVRNGDVLFGEDAPARAPRASAP